MPREQVLSSLVEYSAFGTLRRLILEVVAFNLTPTQIQDLGKVFRTIDKKQRGTISLEDIKDYLVNKDDQVLIPQGIEDQMNAVEAVLSKSGRAHHEINYNDFVAAIMWRRIQYDEEKMQMVFEALDVHRQGFLTRESIRQVVGLDKKQEEIDRMFDEADANQDGCIDYTDFVGLWKAHVVDAEYKPYVEMVEVERNRVRLLLQAASFSTSAASASAASSSSTLARTDSVGSVQQQQSATMTTAGPITPLRAQAVAVEAATAAAGGEEEKKKRKGAVEAAEDGTIAEEAAAAMVAAAGTVNGKRRRVIS